MATTTYKVTGMSCEHCVNAWCRRTVQVTHPIE